MVLPTTQRFCSQRPGKQRPEMLAAAFSPLLPA